RERFRREGRLASLVIHPRCVFVLGADEEAGRPYIVMELMPGRTLSDVVTAQGPLPVSQAVRYIIDIIEGLQEAHANGMIHRDVKPSNCFLDAEGRVKIGDFGLAKAISGREELTRSGAFLGTFLYASPEQIRNDKVDHLTDVYSVCATLYHLLTGRAPFEDSDPAAALARTVSDPLMPMRTYRPDLPATLDEIVLKGLARNRKQRWQSLEELRLALLPFVEGQHSLAQLGARSAAFILDFLILTPLMVTISLALFAWGFKLEPLGELSLSLLGMLLYFGLPEAVFGCSVGKWLLGLRVRQAEGGDRPTLLQAFLRTIVFWLLLEGMTKTGELLAHWGDTRFPSTASLFFGLIRIGGLPALGWLLGLTLLTCTMRRASGYRGLHEWISGTRTIQLPSARPRFVLPTRQEWPTHNQAPTGLPERLGAFRVLGFARRSPHEAVLYGTDAALERPVWLWLRDGEEPCRNRRDAARPGRARWLGGGEHQGQRWDAFVATSGCLLSDLLARRGRLPWRDASTILEQLADELRTAQWEGTLPSTLSPQQVWVQPNGRVTLLDMSPRETTPVSDPFELLQLLSILMLEGKQRSLDSGPVRAPVPAHAAEVLNKLMAGGYADLTAFRDALRATHDFPEQITWPGRALQVALCGLFCFPGLALMFATGPVLLAFCLYLTAIGQAQIPHLVPEGEQHERLVVLSRQKDTILETALWPARPGLSNIWNRIYRGVEPEMLCDSPDATFGPAPLMAELYQSGWLLVALGLFWPLLWALGSAMTRGGFSLWLVGIRLLDGEGRRAAWWRCALRSLLVWGPVGLLLGLSLWLDVWRYAHSAQFHRPSIFSAWFSQLCWWTALALLPLYAALAVMRPNRGLHDRLAGTYPVP
ncbi:MAG: protein kinase, partial [Gemmataceae bacterium]